MATLEISEAELGRALTLAPGDELVLDLNERPSTGYRWAIEQIDPAVLAAKESDYRAQGSVPGAATTRRMLFVAVATGLTALRLKRARGPAVDRRVSIDVTVR